MAKYLIGKAQTVLGLIESEKIGITLPHEHLLLDLSTRFVLPDDRVTTKAMAEMPVSMENLGWLRCNWYHNIDNLRLDNIGLAIKEVERFRNEGGSTIVDQTNNGLGRDPQAIARISRATGVNVIMGSGYYVSSSPIGPELKAKSVEQLGEEIAKDIFEGVDGICAGIIGEIGADSWPLCEEEKKSLKAASLAQKATGASINVHTGRRAESHPLILEILEKAGANLNRVILSHLDRDTYPMEKLVELAKTGCCLEFDLFGTEGYHPQRYENIDTPNDAERINRISELVDKGFLNQILISHDTHIKIGLAAYGGHGYDHILRNVLPWMLEKGFSKENIDTIIKRNPKRLLTFV